jgi:hypothetical protein
MKVAVKRYNVRKILSRGIFLGILFSAFAAGTFSQPRGAGAIVAIDEAAGGGGVVKGAQGGSGGGVKTSKSGGAKTSTSHNKTSPPTRPIVDSQKTYNGPIVGDKYAFLNFEVAEPVQPIHTNAAKAAGASGLVQVEILVDVDGRVLLAKARTGNKLLWPEAERAALASGMNRPVVDGRPARAIGFLVYRFGKSDDDDDN